MQYVHAWLGTNNVPIFRRAFADYAVVDFAVRVVTWLEILEIVFFNSATENVSSCVAIAIFASARVWSCCILVKIAALACADFTLASYPSVFKVMDDIQVSLNTLAK